MVKIVLEKHLQKVLLGRALLIFVFMIMSCVDYTEVFFIKDDKWQVSKDILKAIKSAYFTGGDNKNIAVDYYDYGDSFAFEIPFSVLSQNDVDTTKIVVVQ